MFTEIVSLLWVISVFVMFIGFWLSTDYYTNQDEAFRFLFWIANGITLAFSVIVGTVSGSVEGIDKASTYVMNIITFSVCTQMIVTILVYVVDGFIRSRKYFAAKRNKRV